MADRAIAVAGTRAANAAFFVLLSAYCLMASSPFAYSQFVKPNVLPALTMFVDATPWMFWIPLAATIATVLPQLRGGRGRFGATVYVIVLELAGGALIVWRPLTHLENRNIALGLGFAALVPPVWLTILDHRVWPAVDMRPAARDRALASCGLAAIVTWAIYTLAVPFRVAQSVGIDMPPGTWAAALGVSFVFDLYVFAALFLAMMAVAGIAAFADDSAPTVEYWLFVGLLASCTAGALYLLVCTAIAFTEGRGMLASAALGATIALVWADIGRIRSSAPALGGPADSLACFGAPIVGGRGPQGAAVVIVAALPFVAYALVAAVVRFDWNFLVQKLGVLTVWLTAFTAVHAAIGDRRLDPVRGWHAIAAPLVVLLLYAGVLRHERQVHVQASAGAQFQAAALDRYSGVDPSFRLFNDARTRRSSETMAFYAYLRAQTFVDPARVRPAPLDFVRPIHPSASRRPHIFLFVVDSLRRDYLSVYNPGVAFTPALARFAAGGYAFERAFTRYAGTALAVPSIFAGAMVAHTQPQPEFGARDTLLKLLVANQYVRMMDLDHLVAELEPPDPDVIQLDRGRTTMQFDLCRTVTELEGKLTARDPSRPVFFYALSQNAHISIASQRRPLAGEAFPGFYAPMASSVRRLDDCIGGFLEFLERTGLYDDSIVILTSDHGDSLGEEGRWGHAYFAFPEVMRIPLIVHLPSWMRDGVSADLDAVSFSTDISPTLYALLGYAPADVGPLGGHPLFVGRDGDTSWRRRQAFLIACSNGAVYGTLRQNGRRLYVADTVDGRDYAFDLSSGTLGTQIEATPAAAVENRRLIEQQLDALGGWYHYAARTPDASGRP